MSKKEKKITDEIQNTPDIHSVIGEETKETIIPKKVASNTLRDAKSPSKKTKSETTKKATSKKVKSETTKSTTTKTVTKPAASPAIFVQFAGKEIDTDIIIQQVQAIWSASGHTVDEISSLKLYIKPEETAAYYVINEIETGKIMLY